MWDPLKEIPTSLTWPPPTLPRWVGFSELPNSHIIMVDLYQVGCAGLIRDFWCQIRGQVVHNNKQKSCCSIIDCLSPWIMLGEGGEASQTGGCSLGFCCGLKHNNNKLKVLNLEEKWVNVYMDKCHKGSKEFHNNLRFFFPSTFHLVKSITRYYFPS